MAHKLLIVDDEKNIRMTLKQCFSEEKYVLDMAVDGEDALEKLNKNNYDLVLLDIRMPKLTGIEVLEKMREESINTDVVIMTAYGSVDKAVETMKLGAIDFIGKPFTPEQIREVVGEVLARESLVKEDLKSYSEYLQFAKKKIMNQEYEEAEYYLKKSITKEVQNPEPYNLLGIIEEFRDNLKKAQKHYRAALAYDFSYSPARANLNRSSSIQYTKRDMDLGEIEIEKEEKQWVKNRFLKL